ncbi:hypothetical protein [Aeoliella mucimassa]|uniref:Uncharacterized protein n=1 Tax=Aeoliella mucimassa TaxID=2527972 RepID=A0A518AIB0_9BACT|nr:hypothetical protein [Aeoliella mucimassa]QDU54456.1 hypothetical protein Pan181_06380 [Aeoliella mucimassa]
MDESPRPPMAAPAAPPPTAATAWRLGPVTWLMVLAFAGVDLAICSLGDAISGDLEFLVFLGFTYGQAAAAMIWLFSDRIQRRGLTLLLAEVISLAISTGLTIWSYGINRWDKWIGVTLIVMTYTHLVLGFMLLGHLVRHLLRQRWPSQQPLWFPQFRMIHLLFAMVATATIATSLRFASEDDLSELLDWRTYLIYSLFALAAASGGILLLNHPLRLWRLGAFATSTLLISFVACWLSADSDLHLFFMSQSLTVAVALLIPRVDRYRIHVLVEPPDEQAESRETPEE